MNTVEIAERENDGITILDLDGPLTFGEGDSTLREKLIALRLAGKVNVVLNLKEVDHLDSAGLGLLVFGLARFRNAGGNLALLNLQRTHLRIFQLTRVALAFELFEDEQDAVNSFFPDRCVTHFDILSFVEQERH